MIMKRFIKRLKNGSGELFAVFDESGREIYLVNSFGSGIIMNDKEGRTLLRIRQIVFRKMRLCSIYSRSSSIKLFFNPRKRGCWFYGTGWQFVGDVYKKSFDIIDTDNSLVCSHAKSFCNGRSCYLLDITNESDEVLCIGAAICVESMSEVESLCPQTV